jgi:hypothetical protein
MPHEHRPNHAGRPKNPLELDENHSHLVDYQQCTFHSVDKPDLNFFEVRKLDIYGSSKLKNVKKKSIIYLYDYAKNFTLLDLV